MQATCVLSLLVIERGGHDLCLFLYLQRIIHSINRLCSLKPLSSPPLIILQVTNHISSTWKFSFLPRKWWSFQSGGCHAGRLYFHHTCRLGYCYFQLDSWRVSPPWTVPQFDTWIHSGPQDIILCLFVVLCKPNLPEVFKRLITFLIQIDC